MMNNLNVLIHALSLSQPNRDLPHLKQKKKTQKKQNKQKKKQQNNPTKSNRSVRDNVSFVYRATPAKGVEADKLRNGRHNVNAT